MIPPATRIWYHGTPSTAGGAMADTTRLHIKLAEMRTEHRDLDEVIARVTESPTHNPLQAQRLKKRKLVLKDQIIKLESKLLPDIIA